MFCGSCMHDNTWARALMAAGAEVSLIPTYTPIRVDEADVSSRHVFFGGINVYLASKWRWWRSVPRFLKHWLDHPAIIRLATRKVVSNNAAELGQLTLDMLAGESGPQADQVEELARFLGEYLRPDVVVLSNALLAGAVRRIKQLFAGPVLCVLQGDDIFLDSLPDSHHGRVLDTLRDRVRDFDGFITHSRYYAEHMAAMLFPLPLGEGGRGPGEGRASKDLPNSADPQKQFVPSERSFTNSSQASQIPHLGSLPGGEGTAARPFHTLPLGIDLTGHDGQPRPAGDPFTVGYFARLCPEKGLHLAVEAFARFHAQHPRTRLRVGGYLGERDQLFFHHVRAQAAQLGPAVEFVEHIDTHEQKVEFLKSLDVLSVPTTYREPKGLPILEALANGVPVVQPAHGSFPELIEATQGGLLFAPGNLDDLVAKWELLLTDSEQRLRLAARGQQQVREKFSSVVMAEQTLQRFATLIRRQEAARP